MSPPPQNCPPLGCSSVATTEDSLVPGDDGSTTVLSRCFEIEPGRKECRTTLEGACAHNRTRCSAGDECSDVCGASCTCDGGIMVCDKPVSGAPCDRVRQSCIYPDSPMGSPVSVCTCTEDGVWAC